MWMAANPGPFPPKDGNKNVKMVRLQNNHVHPTDLICPNLAPADYIPWRWETWERSGSQLLTLYHSSLSMDPLIDAFSRCNRIYEPDLHAMNKGLMRKTDKPTLNAVFDLSAARTAYYDASLLPEEAVRCAHAQFDANDFNTWDYAKNYPFEDHLRIGIHSINMGDQSMVVSRSHLERIRNLYFPKKD